MGADFYESDEIKSENTKTGVPNVGIGQKCLIQNAIIDKNARIGDNAVIANTKNVDNFDTDNYYIRDGIVIVPKDATILPDTVI